METKPPKVSVTVTSYNYAKYIGQTIESILGQTFEDFELVIIDDASTDKSVEVIKKYAARDGRIRLHVNKKNKGYAQTLEDVAAMAQGTYLVHMDSDDWIKSPTAFERQVAILEANPDVVFVYSVLSEYNNKGKKLMSMESFPADTIVPGVEAVQKAMGFYIGHSGPMFRRDAFLQCGGYDLTYHFVLDLKLWFDLCVLGDVAYIADNLYAYRQHSQSMTAVLKHRRLTKEMLHSIDTVFDGPLGVQMDDPTGAKRQAYTHALTAVPMSLVFGDSYRQSWKIMWESIKLRPRESLLNKRTLIITARTVLGAKWYEKVRRLFTF